MMFPLLIDVQVFLGAATAGDFRVTQQKRVSRNDLKRMAPLLKGSDDAAYGEFIASLCIQERLLVALGGRWSVCEDRATAWLCDQNPLTHALRFWRETLVLHEHFRDPFTRPQSTRHSTIEKRAAVLDFLRSTSSNQWLSTSDVMNSTEGHRAFRSDPRHLFGSGPDMLGNEDAVAFMLHGPLAWLSILEHRDDACFAVTSAASAILGGGPLEGRPPWDSHFLVQPDHSVMASCHLHPALFFRLSRLCPILTADRFHTWRLDRDALLAAMDRGTTADDILAFLEANSSVPLPSTVRRRLDDCTRRFGEIELGTAGPYLSTRDPAMLQEIERLPTVSGQVLRRLSETVDVLRPGVNLEQLMRDLRLAGYGPRLDGDGARTAGGGVVQLPLTEEEARALALALHMTLIVLNQTASPAHRSRLEILESLLSALGSTGSQARWSAFETLDLWQQVVNNRHQRTRASGKQLAAGS